MATKPVYDVIIVGGGPAGCSTALALNRTDRKHPFVLIDDADPATFKIGESLPGIAARTLGHLSPILLDRFKQDVSRGDHTRCTGNSSAWSSQHLQEQYSIMSLYGSGWHLDRALFDESLRDAVRDECDKTTDNFVPSRMLRERFLSVEKQDGVWSVHTEHVDTGTTSCYHSRWVVDATVERAFSMGLLLKLGAKVRKTDKLIAFYSLFISSEDDADHRTLIEAAESGWWYTSCVAHNRRIVVYHTDDDDPSAKFARTPDGFLDLLHNHTHHISQIILEHSYDVPPGTRFPRSTAAGSSILDPICDETEHWCAVGDAVMAFDPLSSQGMITALNAGCFIGKELAKRIRIEVQGPQSDEIRSIPEYFEAVGRKYEKEKMYYYRQACFDGEFWEKRRL